MLAELEALVLKWAAAHHPEKLEQTLAQKDEADQLQHAYTQEIRVAERSVLASQLTKKLATYRRFLLRLVEIRCEEDKGWIRQVPPRILDETKVVTMLRDRRTGRMMRLAGKKVEPREPDMHPFSILLMAPHDFDLLMAAWDALDLEYIVEEPNGIARRA